MFITIIKPLTPRQQDATHMRRFEKTIECGDYVIEHYDDHTFIELDEGDKGSFTLEHQEGYELYIKNNRGDTINRFFGSHDWGNKKEGK